MATMLGSLLVSLGLDSGEFKSGLDAADKEMRKTTRKFERMGRDFQRIGDTLTKSLTLPIAALGTAFGVAAGRMAKESKSMANSARLAGEGFEDFQRQAYAARVGVGIEFEKLGDIFKDTQDKIGDFLSTGGGEMADFFENIAPKVGLTAEAFRGLSGMEGLQLLYNSLEKAGVSSDQMVFYMESIADEASGLIPLLRENGRAFKELGANATIITSEDAKQLDDYTQAQLRMEQATRQLTIAFVNSGLLDSLVSIARSVADFAEKLSKASPQAFQMAAGALAIAAALGPLYSLIGNVTRLFAPLAASILTVQAQALAGGVAISKFTAAMTLAKVALAQFLVAAAPFLLILGGLAGAYYLLKRRSDELAQASAITRDEMVKLEKVKRTTMDASERLATAYGKERDQLIQQTRELRANTLEQFRNAQMKLQAARADEAAARERIASLKAEIRAQGPELAQRPGQEAINSKASRELREQLRAAQAEAERWQKTAIGYWRAVQEQTNIINSPAPSMPSFPGSGVGASGGSSSASRASGPSAAEIERQFNSELASIYQATWSAMSSVATSAEERAELELRSVELARVRTLKEIEANEDYNEAQKKMLTEAVDFLADRERAAIEFQKTAELEREAADMLATQTDIQRDKLDLEYDMADTQKDRQRIAADILKLEQEYRRNQLNMVYYSATASDAEKARAKAILDSLDAIEADRKSVV